MSRAFASLTIGPAPTSAGKGFLAIRATTTQDHGVATLTINAALADAIRPRGDTGQRLMVRVTAQLPAGDKVLWGGQVISWQHEETARNGVQWNLVVTGHRQTELGAVDHGPFGWELDYENAPPPGNGTMMLELLYDLPDGSLVPFPLFTGYSMASDRTEEPGVGHRMEFSGMGGEAAIDRAVGEFQLPPNHGQRPGEMATGMLIAGGLPSSIIKIGFDVGPPRNNSVDIPCAEVWEEAKRCMREGAGHDLYFDRVGDVRSRVVQGGIFA